jgi:hypothetical protein
MKRFPRDSEKGLIIRCCPVWLEGLGREVSGAGSFCERDNGAWRALQVLAGWFLKRDRSLRDFKDLGHANGGWVTVMGQ